MIVWLDEHLSPHLAPWIKENFGIAAHHLRDLDLARASDREVFDAARKADAVLLTKDADFVALIERHGPPPRVIWLTCGNTSNASLKRLLGRSLNASLDVLGLGEALIEIV